MGFMGFLGAINNSPVSGSCIALIQESGATQLSLGTWTPNWAPIGTLVVGLGSAVAYANLKQHFPGAGQVDSCQAAEFVYQLP